MYAPHTVEYVESKKKNKIVTTAKLRLTDKQNKLVVSSGAREGGRSKCSRRLRFRLFILHSTGNIASIFS